MMTNEQLAIKYFEDGIKNTSTGNWIVYKEELERWAGREVDPVEVGDAVFELFGDYMLDDESSEECVDMMFGGYYCNYMNYRKEYGETLKNYANAIWEEYREELLDFEDPLAEWKHANEEYDRCQEYLAGLKQQYKEG